MHPLLVFGSVASSALPAPARLLVEYLDFNASGSGQPPVVSTAQPRFSFLPHDSNHHPGNNVSMSAYQIVVREQASGRIAWDSGKTAATDSAATAVKAAVSLKPLMAYTWQAKWWSQEATLPPSPTTTASFIVGPLIEADWAGSVWLGGDQNEFKLTYAAAGAAAAMLFVSSPGGIVVYSRAPSSTWTVVGDDEIGLSPWVGQ